MRGEAASETILYLAYLLRLWRVETENGPVWRAALEDPHGIEHQVFADLSALCRFLDERTSETLTALEKPGTQRESGKENM